MRLKWMTVTDSQELVIFVKINVSTIQPVLQYLHQNIQQAEPTW